jgi:Domain of unknown function (DUF5666)
MKNKGVASALTAGLAILLAMPAMSQPSGQQNEPPPPPQMQEGMRPGMGPGMRGERTGGAITSVGVDRFELKRMNGETQTILVDDQTRIHEGSRENQKTLEIDDLKPGDHVLVMGKLNDHKEFVASEVRRDTPEEMARFQNAGDRAFGQIVSIEGNEIKVHNQFRGDQTIVVNDQTTFTRDGQAITLKDLKVGDRIGAMGKETGGKLAAERVMTGRMMRGHGRGPMMRPPSGDQPPQNQ